MDETLKTWRRNLRQCPYTPQELLRYLGHTIMDQRFSEVKAELVNRGRGTSGSRVYLLIRWRKCSVEVGALPHAHQMQISIRLMAKKSKPLLTWPGFLRFIDKSTKKHGTALGSYLLERQAKNLEGIESTHRHHIEDQAAAFYTGIQDILVQLFDEIENPHGRLYS